MFYVRTCNFAEQARDMQSMKWNEITVLLNETAPLLLLIGWITWQQI